ncbi:MAG: substrate-binding domain-containing protein, partial [Chromatiales bacterium]|nr:substrate-binding domain-containing protein [Chromatiales bacterium]
RLGAGVYDLAVCDEPLEPVNPAFRAEPLFPDWHVFVAAPGHALAGAAHLELTDLLEHEWICLGPFCRSRVHLNQLCEAAGVKMPGHIVETTDIELTMGELLSARYLSFMPRQLIHRELAAGVLRELPVSRPPPPTWKTLMLSRKGEPLSPALQAFVEILRSAATSTLPAPPVLQEGVHPQTVRE